MRILQDIFSCLFVFQYRPRLSVLFRIWPFIVSKSISRFIILSLDMKTEKNYEKEAVQNKQDDKNIKTVSHSWANQNLSDCLGCHRHHRLLVLEGGRYGISKCLTFAKEQLHQWQFGNAYSLAESRKNEIALTSSSLLHSKIVFNKWEK